MDLLNQSKFLQDAVMERQRQENLGFGQEFDDQNSEWEWSAYLTRLATRSLVKTPSASTDMETYKRDLVKVAATAMAAYESICRKESK